ncbi:MAG: hypothetical protein NZ529_06150 [Cytophagaceae bacterium]|nr:hypothetical protein [Cytophagaceae bacterium]MDW8456361.1 hypothetical protein [Cytophagaceae bacterium]
MLYFLNFPIGNRPAFPFASHFGGLSFLRNLKRLERICARDGSHGLQGQCGALAEHRSDSGVANSPAPQGRAQHKKLCLILIWVFTMREEK